MSPRFLGRAAPTNAEDIPPDMWEDCPGCRQLVYAKDIEPFSVCNRCGHHFRLSVAERLAVTADEGTFEEWDAELPAVDPLGFPDYAQKLARAREKTQRLEGVLTGRACLEGLPVALGIMDLAFFGGSMGYVVGERVARLFERGAQDALPVLMFCASGGARMQESIVSLMQMPKTSGAAGRLRDAGAPHISILLDPTYGGVTASYALLGDIILAEPGVRLGFAGPRVIEVTKQRLPPEVQTARFHHEHGMIDAIVPRPQLRETLGRVVRWARG